MPRPTKMRFVILALAVLVALLLYLDRFCLSTADRAIKVELGTTPDQAVTVATAFAQPAPVGTTTIAAFSVARSVGLTETQVATLIAAFFLPYALGQIPAGWLADRFGSRRMLTFYMVAWSVCTGLLGLARGYWDFYLYRLGCGLFEAGGYPACAGIIKRWIPLTHRGLASGIVSIGGRLGGAVTPMLTSSSMLFFAAIMPSVYSWRPTFILFGGVSLAVAVLFWCLHRDTPEEHPLVNEAEVALIRAGDSPPPPPTTRFSIPWGAMLTNRSLWLSSFVQFGSNFGWALLMTYLNRYLNDVHRIDDLGLRGQMISTVMIFSLPSLILGGLLTDRLTRRYGVRIGRMIPLTVPRFVAAALYASVPLVMMTMDNSIQRTWAVIVVFGLIAFFNDLTLSAIWAFNMDIGGRNVGLVLGWGNMWGNLGAWLSPLANNWIVSASGWNAVFFTCGGVFAAIAVASLFIDANEKVEEAA